MQVKVMVFNELMVNTYILYDNETKEAVVIDPGMSNIDEYEFFLDFINFNNLNLTKQLITHGHFDHIWGATYLKNELNIPIYANARDLFLMSEAKSYSEFFGLKAENIEEIDVVIDEGDKINLGESKIDVISLPGHSPGHLGFYLSKEKIIFSGDVLFKGSIGRTDLPGGDLDVLLETIHNKLMRLGEDVLIYPGHGPETTIYEEFRNNPYIL